MRYEEFNIMVTDLGWKRIQERLDGTSMFPYMSMLYLNQTGLPIHVRVHKNEVVDVRLKITN